MFIALGALRHPKGVQCSQQLNMGSQGSLGKSGRTRNFATIMYLDSAPENWQQIISDWMIPVFVSPYHDQDINPDGTQKEPHYHVMVMFDSVKTVSQAKELFSQINGRGVEVLNSTRSYARYLCHLDHMDKAQYKPEDVISFCGADYFGTISLASDRYSIVPAMQEFCIRNNIRSYLVLSRYAALFEESWHRALTDNCSYTMERFLKEARYISDDFYNSVDEICRDIWVKENC